MKYRDSIFDSDSERKVYHLLNARWANDYLVSDHVPVRNVLGWPQIKALNLPENDKRYLLSADFDFVVCTKDEGEPLLVVEFDGFSRGYSRNGRHVSKMADDKRRHRFNVKLNACEACHLPMVVVSYEEAFWGNSDMLTILDAIIGCVIATKHTDEEVHFYMEDISRALENDLSGDIAGAIIDEMTLKNELKYNPVVRRIVEMRKQIGYSGKGIEFIRDREHLGYVSGRFILFGGIRLSLNKCEYFEYKSITIDLRSVNCMGCSETILLWTIGHYLLLHKAIKEFGSTRETFWRNAKLHGKWVER